MRYIFFVLFLILVSSCAKQKSILICGDHKCVNKSEAKQYFEDNLTIEVQILSKDKKSSFNLVDLNTQGNETNIKVFKNKKNKILKKLSKDEIKTKKVELKKKNEKKKFKTKSTKKNNNLKQKTINKELTSYSFNNTEIDICQKLEKCDIDSITDYLIKASNDKKYPNISLRE